MVWSGEFEFFYELRGHVVVVVLAAMDKREWNLGSLEGCHFYDFRASADYDHHISHFCPTVADFCPTVADWETLLNLL